ncbi:MAG: hypothetical protein WC862_04425 [Patescibacteria group bacterium]
MKLSHHRLHPRHIYQLEIIFLFAAGIFLMFPYYLLVEEYRLDMTVWQWYYIIPWMIFYTLYGLKQRAKIPADERISPLKRPIGHWMLLGITIIMIHLQPINLERIYGIDAAFAILSLFLADSYWDFKKLKLFYK